MKQLKSIKESFLVGYKTVKNGLINNELTNREIIDKYPDYQHEAFKQGMIDALCDDDYRYNNLK